MTSRRHAFAAVAALATGASAAEPVRYVDAHSHVAAVMPVDEEIDRLRRTGLERVVIMNPEPEQLRLLADRHAGFVIPFLSVARTPQVKGIRLDADTAGLMARMQDAGEICGFGELPSQVVPENEPSEAAAVDNGYRRAIYAAADARGVPVNLHVSLKQPETVAAIGRIAAAYPRMALVLAHAGWDVGPEVLAPLLAAHRNLHADLSVRLDRPRTDGRPSNSIVRPDGTLLPEWRALILRFPDRFQFGLDIGLGERPQHIAELAAQSRETLGRLPRATEELVAHGNIERLLKGCRLASIPENPVGYSGTLVSYTEDSVVLRGKDDTLVTVALTPGWTVSATRPGTLAAIRPGDFVASIQTDVDADTGTARELRVFEPGYVPEIGTHAMPERGASITHGKVASIRALADGGRELRVSYPGGSRRIIVPATVRVTRSEVHPRAEVTPGTTVSVVSRRRADGTPIAGRLVLPAPRP